MNNYHVPAGPSTCQWGYLDASDSPVLAIKSGDRVVIDTVSGSKPFLPPVDEFMIPNELLEIHANVKQGEGPHILTGPIAVEGARPGDVLEVKIEAIELYQDWGLNTFRPLSGTLPYDFPEIYSTLIPLDKERMVGILPWGLELPLSPFFGIMAVAPPPKWGRVSSIMPRAFGGNLDNKELIAGTTLYLPIFNEGALFSCGDGHGAQGDGEVNVNAIETGLRGTFTLIVRKDLKFVYPRAETSTHYITMGMDPDLDQCVVIALRDMIALIMERVRISKEDAYTLCSIAGDLHITQTVNSCKGVHMMIKKELLI
jgi:acetamidase/formamidase